MTPIRNSKILLDTNVIIYSLNSASPNNKAAQEFIKSNNNLTVAHQNITEGLRILTHPKFKNPFTIKRALRAVMEIADKLDLISPNSQTMFVACDLIKRYNLKSNHVFDAYLAATALSNGIGTIATDNEKDFRKLKVLKVTNPFIKN